LAGPRFERRLRWTIRPRGTMQRLRKERIRTGASCESTAPWTSRVRTPLAQRPVPQYPLDSLEEAPSHAASGSMIRAEASPGTRGDYRFRVGERQTRESEGAREQGSKGARERGTETRLLHLFCDFLRKGWARIVSPMESEEMFVHLVRSPGQMFAQAVSLAPANVRFLGCDFLRGIP
jgi:hypothetical protein